MIKHTPQFAIDFIHSKGATYELEGHINNEHDIDIHEIKLFVNADECTPRYVKHKKLHYNFDHSNIVPASYFKIDASLTRSRKAKITAQYLNKKIPIKSGYFTGLSTRFFSYKKSENEILVVCFGNLYITSSSQFKVFFLEIIYLLCMLGSWRIAYVFTKVKNTTSQKQKFIRLIKAPLVIGEAIITIPGAIILRCAYHIAVKFKKRPIWIVSDRPTSAGDNGEALFRYIVQLKDCPADVFFAIAKKSKDYERMKKVGPLLDYGNFRYKIKFLLADKIISSHADTETTNPFSRQIERYVNLFSFDFVFLQHGIIRNDLSDWLNRFDKNISLFVTSAQKEYDSILKYPYYYEKERVLLSGLPRYDRLESKTQNKLIIAPTYRSSMLRLKTNRLGRRRYDSTFQDSEYFNFYNELINDTTLLDVMRHKNMTGEFLVHPNFATQASDFKGNDVISVKTYPYDYNKAIREGALLVSDFSSLVFDFAYLYKPVIYAQFDANEFYTSHSYTKGDFFDDKKDGFGPVCDDYVSTIKELVNVIRNDNIDMPNKYKERVDQFFAFHDKNNSKRVYDAVVNEQTRQYNGERDV